MPLPPWRIGEAESTTAMHRAPTPWHTSSTALGAGVQAWRSTRRLFVVEHTKTNTGASQDDLRKQPGRDTSKGRSGTSRAGARTHRPSPTCRRAVCHAERWCLLSVGAPPQGSQPTTPPTTPPSTPMTPLQATAGIHTFIGTIASSPPPSAECVIFAWGVLQQVASEHPDFGQSWSLVPMLKSRAAGAGSS